MTKREWAERRAAEAAEREKTKTRILAGDHPLVPAATQPGAGYAPDAWFTVLAQNLTDGWFDLGEYPGIAVAFERANAWRQDARLARFEIHVMAGRREAGFTLAHVGTLSEVE